MSEMKEVYVGNGRTIHTKTNEFMRVLDWEKLIEIEKANPGKKLLYGMREDWFFTAEQVEDTKKLRDNILVASSWATPVVEIEDETQVECFVEVPNRVEAVIKKSGYDRYKSKIGLYLGYDFMDKFESDKLEYEDRQELKKQFTEILDKKLEELSCQK